MRRIENKNPHFVIVLGAALFLSLPMPMLAEDLDHYRELLRQEDPTLPELAQTHESVAARVDTLRKKLGFQHLRIQYVDASGQTLAYPSQSIRPHRQFASSYFKEMMRKVASKIRLMEQYSVPPVFQPSSFMHELQQEAVERRKKIFDEEISAAEFDRLIAELHGNYFKHSLPAANSRSRTAFEDKLTEAVSVYLHANQPTAKVQKISPEGEVTEEIYAITDRLGSLKWAEVYDSFVTRLVFENKPEDKIEISLSMLITFRTGEDQFYVLTLMFLRDRLQSEIDRYYQRQRNGDFRRDESGAPILKKLTEAEKKRHQSLMTVVPLLDESLFGATVANEKLSLLSLEQIDFLIDLLLQLRVYDLPYEGELRFDDNQSWTITRLISEVGIEVENRNKNLPVQQQVTFSDKLGVDVTQANFDYKFYQEMNLQLYQLENYLEEEKMALEIHEQRMKQLRESSGEAGK